MKITLENLTKRFPGRGRKDREITAVNRFNFEIPSGRLIALLGPSGCGKSTTLLMICGLLRPTEGRILFDEADVTNVPPQERGVGLVFQNYALYPHMTVEQNIMFPLGNFKGSQKLSKEEMRERSLQAAKLVQIDSLMDRRPRELSGGQQQRVAIARALVKMPSVLLMDEPLSNLDARLRLQTRAEIRRIQRETGITTIFVTHDQEEAMSISDMIVVMREGEVQQIGPPQRVYDDPRNLFVAKFLGTPPINVFEGSVKGRKVYIGEEDVFDICDLEGTKDTDGQCAGPKSDNGHVREVAGQDIRRDSHVWEVAGQDIRRDGQVRIILADDEISRPVFVAIRPEGFIPDKEGGLTCNLKGIEVMGRDVTILSTSPYFQGSTVRSIIDAGTAIDTGSDKVRFRIRPGKILVFAKDTEERLYGDK